MGHPPVSLTASRGQFNLIARYAQGQQMSPSSTWSLPGLPEAHTHPPPEPVVQIIHCLIGSAMAEVVEPSGDVPPQDVDARWHVPSVASGGNLPDTLLEPFDCVRRPA